MSSLRKLAKESAGVTLLAALPPADQPTTPWLDSTYKENRVTKADTESLMGKRKSRFARRHRMLLLYR